MIIFLGDSITEWGNWKTLLPEFEIENYGFAGNKTYQILDRVDELFGKEAHQLFLLVGINDLGDNRSLVEIVSNYNKLVSLLVENKVSKQINLISVLPIVEYSWQKPGVSLQNIYDLNNEIKLLSQEHNINFIDIHSSFADETGNLKQECTTDGLHLSEVGYLKYAELIKSKLSFVEAIK